MFTSDTTLPHAWARDPSRQFELAERRCKLLLSVLRGVARALQAARQQSTHVLLSRQVILWRQLDEYLSSRWNVEVRPSYIDD